MLSFDRWIKNYKRPLIISGPCSAESPEQMLQTVKDFKSHGVNIIRAGAWKPRTRPGSFEGFGVESLKWIKEAGISAGLPVITEVARPEHVEAALKADIDMLWIGARTTVNPFLVHEIAEALPGIDIPVLVKNPVNPDIDLWIGSIERFIEIGITKIAAIHRGFSSYENNKYRNKPNWEIPIELRRRMPLLPLICDPSHICGNTTMLHDVSQIAMDLQYDGLMIESHCNPATALSDAKQQLTPDKLKELISTLIVRNNSVDDVFELSKLEDLRDQIDEIDDEIINTLALRMGVARQIGRYKKKNNVAILQPERWADILRTRTKNGTEKKLTREFLEKLYSIIHQESIFQQTTQMNPGEQAVKEHSKLNKE